MPWDVVADDPACPVDRPFGVHKFDGTLEGCHPTQNDAEAQQAALYAAESARAATTDTYEPPRAVRTEAAMAVQWIKDGLAGDGFTAVGRRRASQLANGDPVSLDTLQRMRSYFARHQVDKDAQGFRKGETGFPTPGRVAWSAWGGDPAERWSTEVLDMIEKETGRSVELRSIDESVYPVTARQRAMYDAAESLVEVFGQFDTSSGPDGAHYVPASPFAADGLVCSNCVYFEGGRACELVAAPPEGIDPNGICKLWVIPGDLVTEAAAAPADTPMRSARLTDNLCRSLALPSAAQFRAEADGNTLFGHFAVFDQWTRIDSVYEGTFLERIAPGAFTDTINTRGQSIRVLYDHGKDPSIGNKPLGVPTVMREDATGGYYEVRLFDTEYVNELRPALEAGQLGASFRFSVAAESWTTPTAPTAHNPDMLDERTITAAHLWEFGPVTFPAYDAATAGVRSSTDDFMRALSDPAFVVRLSDRLGPNVVEQMVETLPNDVRSDSATTNEVRPSADGNGRTVTNNRSGGTLTAVALTELSARKGSR